MKKFDLNSNLQAVYEKFPEADYRPLIGITGNHAGEDAALRDPYYEQVVRAGGTPVIIPPVADESVIVNTLDHVDGLLLSGGADYNPLWGGEEPIPKLGGINSKRDLPELLITRLAYNRQIPIFGICRGMQTLAMAFGGHVAQDISATATIKHSQDCHRSEPTHTVVIEPDSQLAEIYKSEKASDSEKTTILVNTLHHQAVDDPGTQFHVTAKAPDGTIEAMESSEHKAILGVQWHPEWLGKEGLKLFQWLVYQAHNYHTAKQLHQRILTLDTHCDTPMFFPQGIRFEQRDPRILMDLHKMTDGRLDSVIMAAYLPQPKMGEAFSSVAPHTARFTPNSYANNIFDQIEDIVEHQKLHLSLARTPADLYEDKRKGRKSIMLAIENGLALEHELANVERFAQRGVVYITLCHNGDNDICDSARGCNTHNGVSTFGEQVIREMNRHGIMVDLSHAAEKSFYDALDISATPIVCSHSNCRALCDHPRNLTDDQLRQLAAKGGVAHTTLYAGFLRKDGQASILDAIDHLEHAISIMGIDHVGIGTDFDGDGGVTGFADASEALNFTLHLLRRKFSEKDIRKIWGGNWLRVMAEVQRAISN
ncbi:MAG: gamma-glutamyl-gamma-aminobutyrate hydrolase family protein [Prevotella sp.]|nr:gamma-glutamyl-gamma-aminobutyrate hydrolase family protein [Prevotella sp.]